MYEWLETPMENPFGRFVQLSKTDPSKIEYWNGEGFPIGVTSIQSIISSDDPDEWRYAYMCNEVGDRYLKEETIAVGTKEYDQFLEMSFIRTSPYKLLKTIPNENWRQDVQYTKRSARKEWVRVNLIGKCVVTDDGLTSAGDWIMPNKSKFNAECGKGIKWDGKCPYRFKVLRRLTPTTIEILNSPNAFLTQNISIVDENEQ